MQPELNEGTRKGSLTLYKSRPTINGGYRLSVIEPQMTNSKIMITKELVEKVAQEYLKGTDYELQTCEIDKDKNILVEVDRLGVVDVDFCALLNRHIVAALEELTHEMDDYSLEVGSVSLTAPFKSRIQYEKNLGHNVVVTDLEGKRHSGQLVSVDEDTFTVDAKETLTFRYDEVKQVKYNITF